MNGIRIPPAMPPAGFNLTTAAAGYSVNFEEEKTFWASMLVVVTPNIPRKLKRKKSRRERERDASCLGKVLRRYRIGGTNMKRSSGGASRYDEPQE